MQASVLLVRTVDSTLRLLSKSPPFLLAWGPMVVAAGGSPRRRVAAGQPAVNALALLVTRPAMRSRFHLQRAQPVTAPSQWGLWLSSGWWPPRRLWEESQEVPGLG